MQKIEIEQKNPKDAYNEHNNPTNYNKSEKAHPSLFYGQNNDWNQVYG